MKFLVSENMIKVRLNYKLLIFSYVFIELKRKMKCKASSLKNFQQNKNMESVKQKIYTELDLKKGVFINSTNRVYDCIILSIMVELINEKTSYSLIRKNLFLYNQTRCRYDSTVYTIYHFGLIFLKLSSIITVDLNAIFISLIV